MGRGNVMKKLKAVGKKAEQVARVAKKIENFTKAPGKSLGGSLGAKLGSRSKGQAVGAFLGRIAGTGDYTVRNNTIANRGGKFTGDSVPTFSRTTHGVRVQHREYLGEVIASPTAGAFSLVTYSVNPGLFDTFPWLASFANQFDEWKPNGIVVCFKSMSSTYSGTTSLGTVVIASDYDVLDAPYLTKVEMENAEFSVSCNASQSMLHPIECKVSERPSRLFYTRSGAVPTTDNLRFFDLCNFQVATQGCVANQVCGELWLSYDITLFKPQLYGGIVGRGQLYSLWTLGSTAVGTSFSTGATLDTQSTIQDITLAGNVLTFPERYVGATWLVTILVAGTAATTTSSTVTIAGGMTNKTVGGSITFFNSANGASQSNWFTQDCWLQVASPGVASTLTFSSCTWPTTPIGGEILVMAVNPALTT
jgi:hypothetical protein